MRPVGAPHGVALRHFLRNKGLAAGLVPMMGEKGLEMRPDGHLLVTQRRTLLVQFSPTH